MGSVLSCGSTSSTQVAPGRSRSNPRSRSAISRSQAPACSARRVEGLRPGPHRPPSSPPRGRRRAFARRPWPSPAWRCRRRGPTAPGRHRGHDGVGAPGAPSPVDVEGSGRRNGQWRGGSHQAQPPDGSVLGGQGLLPERRGRHSSAARTQRGSQRRVRCGDRRHQRADRGARRAQRPRCAASHSGIEHAGSRWSVVDSARSGARGEADPERCWLPSALPRTSR